MTEPTSPPLVDTPKHARDMTPAERQAFLQQCRKLESASPQSTPVDTRSALDMSEKERAEWLAEHKRKFK
jgi:hypothetical protein